MLPLLRSLAGLILFVSFAHGALAQGSPAAAGEGAALLVADSVSVEEGGRLRASGNVEVLHQGTRLRAAAITYDEQTGMLEITGPLRIVQADGTILIAEQADLSRDLQDGLMRGARMVLDQQLQLAAPEARRQGGRYTQLSKASVTSCRVCAETRAPLWQIRASRVIHDEQERQLYFDNAQLRILDVPVFYLPRMRLPDPTLKRARGFLIPKLRSSSILGFGIETPYFIPMGPHQDITLTPYLAQKTRTLGYRYRRLFQDGDLQVDGALSSDDLGRKGIRGYVFANGRFDLRHEIKLDFSLGAVSDIAYLNDYDISPQDRLDSHISLTRVKRDSLTEARLTHYQSLRASENDDTQPTMMASLSHERRMFEGLMGGELRAAAALHGHMRWSKQGNDGSDPGIEPDGRDVSRLSADLSWRKRWTLMGGLRAGLRTHLWMDRYSTGQDETAKRVVSRAMPGVALDLRLPLARAGAGGGGTLIEPIAMIGWTGGTRGGNPNDESTRVEFDEGNLLALSRFPALDRREHGLSGVMGLRWLYRAPDDWSASLAMGQVWREEADLDFTRSSGLERERSDLLIAAQFLHPAGYSLSARGLLDPSQRLTKAEASASYGNDRYDLSASYLLLTTDLSEDRDTAQSEWTLDGVYRIDDHWQSTALARYDIAGRRLDRTGLGLQYRNECVRVTVSAARKFASATNLEPSTDFDLSVALTGFSSGGSAKEYARTCAN